MDRTEAGLVSGAFTGTYQKDPPQQRRPVATKRREKTKNDPNEELLEMNRKRISQKDFMKLEAEIKNKKMVM